MSKLHPVMSEVLARCEDPDTVERLCRGDWNRVSIQKYQGEDWVYVVSPMSGRAKRTIFMLEPDDAEFFLDDDEDPDLAALSRGEPLTDEALATFQDGVGRALAAQQEVDRLLSSESGPRCQYCGADCSEGRSWDGGDLYACPTCADARAQRDISPAAADAILDLVALDAELRHPLCPCGCGQPVINAPVGRQRKYATDKCRKRFNNAARYRASQPEMQPTTPVVEPELPEPDVEVVADAPVTDSAPVVRRVWCGRCEQDGHYAEDCPFPSAAAARRAREAGTIPTATEQPAPEPAPDPFVASQQRAKVKTEKPDKDAGPRVITCARCHEPGHSVFTCSKQVEVKPVTVRAVEGDVTDDDLAAHSNALRVLCAEGLPDRFQYTYHPDVLALYGVDFDLLDGALRHPQKVELRPESFSKDKRYCVLSFTRGDLEVILGMRQPATPKVIAVYANARLEADHHRVNHVGGGGSKGVRGLPGTPKQLGTRLRSMGCEVEIDERSKAAEVTYRGQSLGKVTCQGDRKTVESDYQRIVRKVDAIDQRATA